MWATELSVDLASIHPTRQELLRLRRLKAMADGIVDILKKDIDALTLALFELTKTVPSLRNQIRNTLGEAYDLFLQAEMVFGSGKIEEVSMAASEVDFDLVEEMKSGILGIGIPFYRFANDITRVAWPRYSLLETPAKIDEATSKVHRSLTHIVKLAETEASIRAILDVISTKRRQMNRIQYRILPELDAAMRYIELVLEETERQDAIRVRVLQRRRKELAQNRSL